MIRIRYWWAAVAIGVVLIAWFVFRAYRQQPAELDRVVDKARERLNLARGERDVAVAVAKVKDRRLRKRLKQIRKIPNEMEKLVELAKLSKEVGL